MRKISHNMYDEFSNLLNRDGIVFEIANTLNSSACQLYLVKAIDWLKLGFLAQSLDCRFVAIWGCHVQNKIQMNVCFEKYAQYLLLRTEVSEDKPELSSLASIYPAANRAERHVYDMFGVCFVDHPNLIRWTRHKAWSAQAFPLRKNFIAPVTTENVPPDIDYPFNKIEGSGVCEVPVGPVHAGIIEPGHFRFHIAGEAILNLEERLGYVHKGIEKLAEGRNVDGLIRLAGRVSGDSTVAHAWAACQACENAAKIEVPERALFIRAIMAERERIANHLGDVGAICNDVGFAFAYYQLSRLRELWQRTNADIFGHRFMMDCLIYGGVKNDLSHENIKSMQEQIDSFRKEATEIFAIIDDNNSLQDRLKTTGILTTENAKKMGALGTVGRASGVSFDLRHDVAYAPYDKINIHVPVFTKGDVASRVKVRTVEILISLHLLDELLMKLPSSAILAKEKSSLNNGEGLGLIEGWRGEILTYVSFDSEGKVSRFFPRDPSWLNWPTLELLIQNNIIPDFPVCNKSVNSSYSGHDL